MKNSGAADILESHQQQLSTDMVLFLYIVIFVTPVLCFDPTIDRIPQNEHDAAQLLVQHLLDSATWERIEPFYQRPLLVPFGELALLHDIFPDLAEFLPTDNDVLTTFFPWDAAQITRFFEVYPVALRFKSILAFSTAKKNSHGEITAILHQNSNRLSSANTLRTAFQFGSKLTGNGTLDCTDDYFRWDRRQITFEPCRYATISVGNKLLFPEKGLVYGAFSVDTNSVLRSVDNWMYGTAPTWNGVSCLVASPVIKRGNGAVLIFAHYRPAEQISGGRVAVKVNEHIGGWLGMSTLSDKTKNNDYHYVHNAFAFTTSTFRSELTSAVALHKNPMAACLWENRITAGKQVATVSFLHYPESFIAPRSILLRRCKNELDDSVLHSPVTRASISIRYPLSSNFACGTAAEIWWYNRMLHHATVTFHAEHYLDKTDVEVDAQTDISRLNTYPACTVDGTFRWKVNQQFTLETMPYFWSDFIEASRTRFSVQSSISLFSNTVITPAVHFVFENNSPPTMFAAYRQKIVLFERTFTEVILEKRMQVNDKKSSYRVTADASYFF